MNAVLGVSPQRVAAGVALAAAVAVAGSSVPVQATPSTAASKVLVKASVAPTHLRASARTVTGQRWAAVLATRGTTDGYVVENDFLPGQRTGWHSHAGPSLIFVVTGTVTNYESDQPHCRGVAYSAGTTFVDQGGSDVHQLVDTGTGPAETIAVQFIPQGEDRRIDEPEPASCRVQ
jgi:quercetin dioxygenase-like cupin family protein